MLLFDLAKHVVLNQYHEKLSPSQIQAVQQKKFRRLVKYVAKHSPYYQELIHTHHIDPAHCQPQDFPILTKADVLEHFDRIVTDPRITKAGVAAFLEQSTDPSELFLGKYYVIHTSGSSGTVGYSLYTTAELACGTAHFARLPHSLGQTLAYVGAVHGHFAGATLVTTAKKIPIIYRRVDLFDINTPFQQIIRQLNRLQPTSLGGYAFALRKLAEAQAAGKLHIQPRVIQSGGEPLSNADKTYIQKIFGVEVVNIYATSEHLIMGIGKDAYNGMYLMEDDLIFEPQPTYTCVTNLFNKTLPLIRYQMSDRLRVIPDSRQLLPFTKVTNIVGRNEHVPIFINDSGQEDFISPILLVEFYVKGVTAFQFHLISKHEFIFRACLDPHLTTPQQTAVIKKAKRILHNILHQKHMTRVKFRIEVVDRLWADPQTRKFQLIIEPTKS